jgi:hypothetical protein
VFLLAEKNFSGHYFVARRQKARFLPAARAARAFCAGVARSPALQGVPHGPPVRRMRASFGAHASALAGVQR